MSELFADFDGGLRPGRAPGARIIKVRVGQRGGSVILFVCRVASGERGVYFFVRGARDEREDPRRVYYYAPPRFCTVREKRHQHV